MREGAPATPFSRSSTSPTINITHPSAVLSSTLPLRQRDTRLYPNPLLSCFQARKDTSVVHPRDLRSCPRKSYKLNSWLYVAAAFEHTDSQSKYLSAMQQPPSQPRAYSQAFQQPNGAPPSVSGPVPGARPLEPNLGRVQQIGHARVLCIADVRGRVDTSIS